MLGIVCLACDGASASEPASTGSLQDLYSRNLGLPTLAPGADCPVTAVQTIGSGTPTTKRNEIPSYGYGTWPVFLSGQTDWFAGEAALILISSEYKGALTVRGRQLDGPGGMPLAARSEPGWTPFGAHGVELAPTSSPYWRQGMGQIANGTGPGCYGLQVDGITFTSQIVFAIKAGPPPPG